MSETHAEEQSRPLMDVKMEQGAPPEPPVTTTWTIQGSSSVIQQDSNSSMEGSAHDNEESTRPRFTPMFDSEVPTNDVRPSVYVGRSSESGTTVHEATATSQPLPSVLQPVPSISTTSDPQMAGLPPAGPTTQALAGMPNDIIQPGPSLSELPVPLSYTSSVPLPYPPFTAPLPSNNKTMQHAAIAVPPTPASHSLTPVLPLRNRSSCTNCRKRKQRCDHGPPGEACRGCLRGGKVCVYPGGIVLTPAVSAAGTSLGGAVGTSTAGKTGSSLGGKETSTAAQGSKKSHRKKTSTGTSVTQLDPRRSLLPSSRRGNREFTDSEGEHFGGADSQLSQVSSESEAENDNHNKRQPRQVVTSSRTSRRTNGHGHGDEVDELDDEEEDQDEAEEENEDEEAAGSNNSGNQRSRRISSGDENAEERTVSKPQQQFQNGSTINGNTTASGSGSRNGAGKDFQKANGSGGGLCFPSYVGYVSTRGERSQGRDVPSRTSRADQSAVGNSHNNDGQGEEEDEESAAESDDSERSRKGSNRQRGSVPRKMRRTHSSSSLDDPLTTTTHDPRETKPRGDGHIAGHAGSTKYKSSSSITASTLLGGSTTSHGQATGPSGVNLAHERFLGGLGPEAVSAADAAATRSSDSPFAERRAGKRKSTVEVRSSAGTEGDVEGEILALVEEDQRPSKHKKGRITSPRRTRGEDSQRLQSNGSEDHHAIPNGGGDTYVQSAGPNARYSADFSRPPPPPSIPSGGFSLSRRTGGGYGMGMSGSFAGHNGALPPGGRNFAHATHQQASSRFMPEIQHSVMAHGSHSAGSFLAAGPSGITPNHQGSQGYLPPPPQQMGLAMPGMRYDQPPYRRAGDSIDYSARAMSHDSMPAFLQSSSSPYASSLAALITVLPPPGTQHILYQTFFQDAFLAEGVTLLQAPFLDEIRYLLHRRSTQQQGQGQQHMPVEAFKAGDATTLALAFAILANALRILPEESSQLMLSSVDPHAYPRGLDRIITGRPGVSPPSTMEDKTPLHRRYMDHAILASVLADAEDSPSPMQVCLKLVCYRYARMCAAQAGIDISTGQGEKPRFEERLIGAGMYLLQGIKVAQAIKLHRERENTPTVERELRRRMFYTLYIADRLHAFETSTPYVIHDHHMSTQLPAVVSDPELYQLSTGVLSTLPYHDYKHTSAPVVHLIVMAHIAKSMSPLMDTLAAYTAADISDEAVDRYDAAFQACEDDLPSYYQISPATKTMENVQDPHSLFHRIDIQSFLYSLRLSLYRPKLNAYLSIKTPHTVRAKLSKLCFRALRIQKSARLQESKHAFRLFSVERVFEAAFFLAFIARVEIAYAAADKSQSHGAAAYPVANTESLEDMQQALHDAIELLDGVTAWPDVGALAVRASKILRKIAKMLSASWNLDGRRTEFSSNESIRSNPHVVRVTSWLKSWRAMSVDTLIVDADYDDWNKVLRSMHA